MNRGDQVAVLSPSFAAPAKWPHVYELGLQRLCDVFGLRPVEFPTTTQLGASSADRAKDLIAAFKDPGIKAVIASLGGDDQVTFVRKLPTQPFADNPKPFFGFSDNTHFANHLWLCDVPSFYGGCLFTQFAMHGSMDNFTVDYLHAALFKKGELELKASDTFNEIGLNWDDPSLLARRRRYEPNDGWQWDGVADAEGVTWGGCLESIDEILRHDAPIPSLDQFDDIVLVAETSEETPPASLVHRVYRALGERGILVRVRAVLVGRPKAWEFDNPRDAEARSFYRAEQRRMTLETVRRYNPTAPIVQNVDFGHTDPQICLPYGACVRVESSPKKLWAQF